MAFPTTSAPTLANWQAQFGPSGLTIGAATTWDLLGIEGIDLPIIRSGDTFRPREHGEFMGLDVYGGRDLVIHGDFVSNGTSLQSAAEAAATAFSWGAPGAVGGQTESPLWIQFPNLPPLAIMCRIRKRNTPIDLAWSVGALAQMTLQFHATDPRLYAAAQSSSCSTGMALAGGVFPATFPYSFSHGSVAGTITAVNAGNIETRPVLTLTGPLTNPVIFNSTAGWQLQVINPTEVGFTIQAGDTVVIDTDTHAVNYFGGGVGAGSSVRNWIVAGSTWPNTPTGVPGLAPGSSLLQLTSTGGSDTGTLACQWASAYML